MERTADRIWNFLVTNSFKGKLSIGHFSELRRATDYLSELITMGETDESHKVEFNNESYLQLVTQGFGFGGEKWNGLTVTTDFSSFPRSFQSSIVQRLHRSLSADPHDLACMPDSLLLPPSLSSSLLPQPCVCSLFFQQTEDLQT